MSASTLIRDHRSVHAVPLVLRNRSPFQKNTADKLCRYAKQGSSKLKKVVEKKTPLDLSSVLNRKLIKLTDSVKNGVFDSKSDPSDTHQNKTQMMITGYTSDDLHMQVQKINKISQKKSNKVEFLLTHPTQTGRVCLYITPENDRCAISRNKSMGCWITALVDHAAVQRILDLLLNRHADELGWTPLTENTPLTFKGRTLVKDVYGGVMGWIDQPLELYRKMRQYRSRGVVYSELGMEWDRLRRTFYFTCDEGRMCRPLLVLEKLEDLIRILTSVEFAVHPDPVAHLIKKGCVEYLDCAEEYCGTIFNCLVTKLFLKKLRRYGADRPGLGDRGQAQLYLHTHGDSRHLYGGSHSLQGLYDVQSSPTPHVSLI